MTSLVHRLAPILATLAGAVWLDLLARGARDRAVMLLSPLSGERIVVIAGAAALLLVGGTLTVALSPLGRARGPTAPWT